MAKGFKQTEKMVAIEDVRVAVYLMADKEAMKSIGIHKEPQFHETEHGVICREVLTATYVDDCEPDTFEGDKPAFQRMIKDAMEGKIDKIVTIETCRFAGNGVATLHYCRLLKEKGVAVAFQELGICSFCDGFEDVMREIMPCISEEGLVIYESCEVIHKLLK